jgi:hypothetical protein
MTCDHVRQEGQTRGKSTDGEQLKGHANLSLVLLHQVCLWLPCVRCSSACTRACCRLHAQARRPAAAHCWPPKPPCTQATHKSPQRGGPPVHCCAACAHVGTSQGAARSRQAAQQPPLLQLLLRAGPTLGAPKVDHHALGLAAVPLMAGPAAGSPRPRLRSTTSTTASLMLPWQRPGHALCTVARARCAAAAVGLEMRHGQHKEPTRYTCRRRSEQVMYTSCCSTCLGLLLVSISACCRLYRRAIQRIRMTIQRQQWQEWRAATITRAAGPN